MALAPARQAGGRAARIADFWRISAVFAPICRGPGAFSPADETRAAVPGSRPPGVGSSPAADAIWAAGRGSRISASDAPAGMFEAGSTGRGAACFTGLIAHSWPVAGHKKTPASEIPAGALSAL